MCTCTGPTGGVCNGVCWKKFKIVSPNGKEVCFPVAVPWWCCDAADAAAAVVPRETEAATTEAVAAEEPKGPTGCMSASQLLLQRYMIANPPRAVAEPYCEKGRYAPPAPEPISCAQLEEGLEGAIDDFQATRE
jgi:hypothetical protein